MNLIERYVEQILAGSTPERPLWNIEKINQGKVNGWNYIDGCMMIALLNLHTITGSQKYFDFAEKYLDYYVLDDGSMRGFKEEDYNLDNLCEGRPLFDVYAATGKEKYRKAIETLYGQILRQPRTPEGNFWHKKIYPNQVWLDGLSGRKRRAPAGWIRLRLEWLYRLIREPGRLGRMMCLPGFVLAVLAQSVKKETGLK